MLTQQSLELLTGLSLPRDVNEQVIQHHFSTEDVITVTKLTRVLDEFDRPTVNNKTIIIRVADYLNQFSPAEAVKDLWSQ